MARAGRKDRGLLSKLDSAGKPKWYARLYHEAKEKRFGPFKDKTEARNFYNKAKLDQLQGRFFPERYQGGGELIEAFIDRYLTTIENKKDQAGERAFAQWWKAWFKGKTLRAITPPVLEEARQHLLSEKRGQRILKEVRRARKKKTGQLNPEGKKRTPQTVNRYVAWLRKVMNIAVRDGKLPNNPVSKLKMFKEPKGRTRFLTLDEEAKVLTALGPIYSPWARLAILTGLRQMEQFGLKWADVDVERGLLTLHATKAGDAQYVYLNEEAKTILQGLIVGNKSVWVFPSENPDTHVDPPNFYERVWMPAVKEAGIEWATWHDLRHTFASRLAMEGATDRDIAAALRHSSTSLVKRYAHLSPSHMRAMVEKVASHGKLIAGGEQVTNQEGVSKAFSNGTVSGTGIEGSVGERSGVEVGVIIGAPDTN